MHCAGSTHCPVASSLTLPSGQKHPGRQAEVEWLAAEQESGLSSRSEQDRSQDRWWQSRYTWPLGQDGPVKC